MKKEMIKDSDLRKAINFFSGKGVHLVVFDKVNGGMYEWSENELLHLIRDKYSFWAKFHGVTKEQYIAWNNWYDRQEKENYRCKKIKKNGKRCNMSVKEFVHPRDFIEGLGDYCIYHEDPSDLIGIYNKKITSKNRKNKTTAIK